jgi:hypothetical protein
MLLDKIATTQALCRASLAHPKKSLKSPKKGEKRVRSSPFSDALTPYF